MELWSQTVPNEAAAQFVEQPLHAVADLGVLVVTAAAGNSVSADEYRYYPARNARVLTVGATENDVRLRNGSSHFGKLVAVFAPRASIVVTQVHSTIERVSSTSMAMRHHEPDR